MVHVGVNVVDPDGVDAEDLHEGCIAKALVLVAEGVDAGARVVPSRATGLVGDTDNLVSGAGGVVDEKGTLDVDGRHGCSQGGGTNEAEDGSLDLQSLVSVALGDQPVCSKEETRAWRRRQ